MSAGLLLIDGSLGEGGGQILRTSMSLAALTGKAIKITNIRAGRPKPGLQRQHLVAVEAAAEVSGGKLTGADLGSTELTFEPPPSSSRGVEGGVFDFDIGSAGSCSLVLQTILPILLFAKKASTVTIAGGTHNGMCPPFDFLRDSFFPLLERCGAKVELKLLRAGFYPAGGGIIRAVIQPLPHPRELKPLTLLERGPLRSRKGVAAAANIPQHVADRQAAVIKSALGWAADASSSSSSSVETVVRADRLKDVTGPGNVCVVQAFFDNVVETATGFGARGVSAEDVAGGCCAEMRAYLDESDAPVGEHLADQLLLPLALMAGGQYRATGRALTGSKHFETNVEVIGMFLGKGKIAYHSAAGAAGATGAGAAGAGAGAVASTSAATLALDAGIVVTVKPWLA